MKLRGKRNGLLLLKHILADSAEGADIIVGKLLKGDLSVIDISADGANIALHKKDLLSQKYYLQFYFNIVSYIERKICCKSNKGAEKHET